MRTRSTIIFVTLIVGCSNEPPSTSSDDTMMQSLTQYESGKIDAIYSMNGPHPPWGDYGRILIHGLARSGEGSSVQLQRTGPFVPPITFPGIGLIIVTNDLKLQMEQAGFRGITFRPVEKTHVAYVPWHEWDLNADDPGYYPEGNAPESYVLSEPHSDELSESIGPIWQVVVSDSAEVVRQTDPISDETTFTYVADSWKGNDLFSVSENSYKYVSPRAKSWLEQHAGKWVSFQSVARR